MCGKARTALHVAFPPKRISLRRHPDFSDPKNRSKRAFKFGLRGRKPTRFTTSRRRQLRNDCLNVVSQSLITHFLSLRKPSSWLVSSRVHVNSTKIDRWPSVKTHIFAVFVARLSILTPRGARRLGHKKEVTHPTRVVVNLCDKPKQKKALALTSVKLAHRPACLQLSGCLAQALSQSKSEPSAKPNLNLRELASPNSRIVQLHAYPPR